MFISFVDEFKIFSPRNSYGIIREFLITKLTAGFAPRFVHESQQRGANPRR
ncbi:MAG: hypothetical protein LBT09_05770 [Planctomycetaceae bacterium]|nr:hypothetical protein [Planctomycetaceae bacterium]